MSLFACEECHCLENTALGFYWGRAPGDSTDGRVLCSACGPAVYLDGTPTRQGGKWHGRFPRRLATVADGVNNPEAMDAEVRAMGLMVSALAAWIVASAAKLLPPPPVGPSE